MSRFRFHLQPDDRYALALDEPGLTEDAPSWLTEDALSWLIDDVIICALAACDPRYPAFLDVELNRFTHEEAIEEIAVAVQQLGYSIVEGEIVEWVDAGLKAALIGLVAGAGFGAATGSPVAALAAGVAGGLIGQWVGSCLRSAEVIYRVHPNYLGHWELASARRSTTALRGLSPWVSPN